MRLAIADAIRSGRFLPDWAGYAPYASESTGLAYPGFHHRLHWAAVNGPQEKLYQRHRSYSRLINSAAGQQSVTNRVGTGIKKPMKSLLQRLNFLGRAIHMQSGNPSPALYATPKANKETILEIQRHISNPPAQKTLLWVVLQIDRRIGSIDIRPGCSLKDGKIDTASKVSK